MAHAFPCWILLKRACWKTHLFPVSYSIMQINLHSLGGRTCLFNILTKTKWFFCNFGCYLFLHCPNSNAIYPTINICKNEEKEALIWNWRRCLAKACVHLSLLGPPEFGAIFLAMIGHPISFIVLTCGFSEGVVGRFIQSWM